MRATNRASRTRQTEAIGKTLRDAMQSKRSLGGQTMESIEAVFRAIDTDGSGDLDYDEFHTVRLGWLRSYPPSPVLISPSALTMYLGCSL